MYKSIVAQIFENADNFPHKTALIEGNKIITYSELAKRILAVKYEYLNKFELSKGDRIIISANKQVGFVFTYLGAHLAGIIVIPIDYDTSLDRLKFIVNKTSPKLLVGFDRFEIGIRNISIDYFEQLECVNNDTYIFPKGDDIADIVFTTGTTGLPKGVILSHDNIAASARNINNFIGNCDSDIELLALPISHSFGLGRIRCVLSIGATLILLGSFVNVKKIFRFFDNYGVTGFSMVPSSWAYIKKISQNKIKDYSNTIRYIELGSAPMSLEDKNLLIEIFPNSRICMHYGLTEASRSSFIEFISHKGKLNTIGKATPNVSISIMDEFGNKVLNGIEGEICVKGDSVTNGYWNEPNMTQDSFFDNYFRTGDWGIMDDSGFIELKSRKKELINVGGKKVSPIEIETVILNYSGVKDCACIGISDPNSIMGEVVKAFVVKELNVEINFDELRKYIGKFVESYKIPVEFEVLSEIPKTKSGKIQRLILKK